MRAVVRPVLAGLALAFATSACGGQSADYEALVEAMTQQAELTTEEATCVADYIFDQSGLTQEQINEGSDDLAENAAFSDAFDEALSRCTDL